MTGSSKDRVAADHAKRLRVSVTDYDRPVAKVLLDRASSARRRGSKGYSESFVVERVAKVLLDRASSARRRSSKGYSESFVVERGQVSIVSYDCLQRARAGRM
jgi:hypothetical protein